MERQKKEDGYLKSFREYQNKIYLPGYYVGSKIHPALKAKTKIGGYSMVIAGILLLVLYLPQLVINFAVEKTQLIVIAVIALLLIIVGIKFIKINSHK
jgi:hypothetical protein